MEKEDIKIDDWDRILFGEGTPLYLLEVVVRVAIVYLIILLAMRLMGKRMVAKVGRSDIVARVSLAAAVGLPIQRPGRGLLVAVVIVTVIVCVGRFLAWLAYRNENFEKKFQGINAPLILSGVIDKKRLDKVRVSQDRLFAALRAENIRHLGQVERLYMEANGEFTLVEKKDQQPGLSVIPKWDDEFRDRQTKVPDVVCSDCGAYLKAGSNKCSECECEKSEQAIILVSGTAAK